MEPDVSRTQKRTDQWHSGPRNVINVSGDADENSRLSGDREMANALVVRYLLLTCVFACILCVRLCRGAG